jgi:phenylpropionate dioxygenase-like ring-hydroxylating dioxygenase large terminal subunit
VADEAPAGEWLPVATASNVEPGAIVDATLDGQDLVVWRTFDGRPCVMDARCPHQWSHLGAEGCVDGDEIVCTSHFWRFDLHGVGTKVNVNGRRDVKADVEVHPCVERDGSIWIRLPGAD